MSTVWVYEDDVDPWETQPQDFTVWAVGPRDGRRYLSTIQSTDVMPPPHEVEGCLKELSRLIREEEGWRGIGVSVTNEDGREVVYASLRDL